MSKLIKKGRNPNGGPLDCWLDSLGYYRKNVAYDETCLFRAVSEQLFSCQLFHEKVRSECIEYARNNIYEFSHIETNEKRWLERLDKLSKHMIICGDVEIYIVSRKYKKNILLFNENELSTTEMKFEDSNGSLYLCFMGEDHYDVVYKKEYISNAGFCQSIVYGIVYESVFHMTQVSEIVDHMLNEKPSTLPMTDDLIQRMKVAEEAGVLINNNEQQQDPASCYHNSILTKNSFENWTDFDANLPSTSKSSSAKHWVESKVQTQRLQLQLGLSAPQNDKLITLKHLYNSKPTNDQNRSSQFPSTFFNTSMEENGSNNMVRAGGCWLYTGTSVNGVSVGANGENNGDGVIHPLTDFEMLICGKIAPFPYKVAKALDPNIYRNIEYDTWSEMRKEMRLCNWYYGDNNFKEGTCCRIEIDEIIYPCYIQRINGTKCDVFLTHSAERKSVDMKDLLPEEDAKPWPIPYRFTKNSQPQTSTSFSNSIDNFKRSRRRSRDKKRTISNGSSNPGQDDHSSAIQNPYEGCPLVQQHSQHTQQQPSHHHQLALIDTSIPPPPITTHSPTPPTLTIPQQPLLNLSAQPPTPTTNTNPPTMLLPQPMQAPLSCHTAASDASSLVMWDTSYWENALPPVTPDTAQMTQWVPMVNGGEVNSAWVEQGQQEGNGGLVSPAVLGVYTYGQYGDPNYYYNNPEGQYANVWTEYPTVVPVTTQDGRVEHMPYMVATPAPTFVHPMSPQVIDPQSLYHHPSTPIPTSYPQTPPGTPILYAPPPLIPPPSQYQDTTSMRPLTHQPLFLPLPQHLSTNTSPLTTAGPLTPLTPTITNATIYHPSSPVVLDQQGSVVPFIQAIPTPTYVYPTTPTWYPPGINAHGFIFPTVQGVGQGTAGGGTAGGTPAAV